LEDLALIINSTAEIDINIKNKLPISLIRIFLFLNNKEIKRIQICADTYQMNELFSNILNNAFDALPDKNGEITVESKIAENRFVKISIKDNDNTTPIDNPSIPNGIVSNILLRGE